MEPSRRRLATKAASEPSSRVASREPSSINLLALLSRKPSPRWPVHRRPSCALPGRGGSQPVLTPRPGSAPHARPSQRKPREGGEAESHTARHGVEQSSGERRPLDSPRVRHPRFVCTPRECISTLGCTAAANAKQTGAAEKRTTVDALIVSLDGTSPDAARSSTDATSNADAQRAQPSTPLPEHATRPNGSLVLPVLDVLAGQTVSVSPAFHANRHPHTSPGPSSSQPMASSDSGPQHINISLSLKWTSILAQVARLEPSQLELGPALSARAAVRRSRLEGPPPTGVHGTRPAALHGGTRPRRASDEATARPMTPRRHASPVHAHPHPHPHSCCQPSSVRRPSPVRQGGCEGESGATSLQEVGRLVIDTSSEACIAAASAELVHRRRQLEHGLSAVEQWERRRTLQKVEAEAKQQQLARIHIEEASQLARASQIAALARHHNECVRGLGVSRPVQQLSGLIRFVRGERAAIRSDTKLYESVTPRPAELEGAIEEALRPMRASSVLALSPYARRLRSPCSPQCSSPRSPRRSCS